MQSHLKNNLHAGAYYLFAGKRKLNIAIRHLPNWMGLPKLVLPILLTLMSLSCPAQSLRPSQMDSVIAKVKLQLLENFVDTAKARLIADSLNSSRFAGIKARGNFMKKLNDLLFLYSHDKHLSVQYVPHYARSLANKKEDRSEQDLKEKNENYGFEPVKMLQGGTAYLKIRYFADTVNAKPAVLQAVAAIQHSKALVLDLRHNTGGSGSMIQLLCSIFLPKPGAPLLTIAYKGEMRLP